MRDAIDTAGAILLKGDKIDMKKRKTFFIGSLVFFLASAGPSSAVAQAVDTKVVHAFLATDKNPKAATKFSADIPTIYLIWKGERLENGDKIRAVWIAEDVGDAAPKESKIGESAATASKPDDNGAISLSRPRGRVWPTGQYRAEIYIGKKFVNALRFAIQPGASVEVR